MVFPDTLGCLVSPASHPWYRFESADQVPSPALIIHRPTVRANLRAMLELVGSPARVWPHIKTAKTPGVVREYLDLRIARFKAATLAEAEMLAQCGAERVVVAYPLVGPNVARFARLAHAYPATQWIALVESRPAAQALANIQAPPGTNGWPVLIDVDVGQHRTGVSPEEAVSLADFLVTTSGVQLRGLHVYDGHITGPNDREAQVSVAWEPVERLIGHLTARGIELPWLLCGGSPTFAIHARDPRRQVSPGTTVFWDAGYAHRLPDLPFEPAAGVLTRVISAQGSRITLDLGTKALASEMAPPRAVFPDLPGAEAVMHSEEHLVLQLTQDFDGTLGDVVFAIPWHICPTVALHQQALVVENHRVVDRWPIVARDRCLSFDELEPATP